MTDVNGTIIGIQGKAISSTVPTDKQILEWNNSNSQWEPTDLPSSLPPNGSAGGDLGSTYPNPTVISITGASGTVNVGSSGNIITWNTATTAPGLKQSDNTTNSATGALMTIQAQNATGTSATGGGLILTSGTGTSIAGNILFKTGGTTKITVAPTLTTIITAATIGSSTGINTFTGGANFTVREVSGDITLDTTTTDCILNCDTTSVSINITFPPPTTGRTFVVIDKVNNFGTHTCLLHPNSSEKINNASGTFDLESNGGRWIIWSNGTDWYTAKMTNAE